MTSISVRLTALLAACAVLTVACIQTSSEPQIVATRIVQAPTAAVPPTQFDFAQGAEVYEVSCAPCHGETGLGDGIAASGFTCAMPAFASTNVDSEWQRWYRITTEGQRTSETCLMPPWENQLSPLQIWNAVAYAVSLRYDVDLVAEGDNILADAQIVEGARDVFAAADWQTERTDAQLTHAIDTNMLEGFDFSSEPNTEAVLVAIRNAGFSDGIADQAQNPSPTPAPVPTVEAATGSNELPGTYQVNGQLIQGTSDSRLSLEGVEIQMRVIGLDTEGQPFDLYSATATSDGNGDFLFADVPRFDSGLVGFRTTFDGVAQVSDQILAADSTGENFLSFLVYEVTNDPASIVIEYTEYIADASFAEGAAAFFQNIDVINRGDRLFFDEAAEASLRIPLPSGAVGAQLLGEAIGLELREENGEIFIVLANEFVPESGRRISLAYNFPYDGELKLQQNLPYQTEISHVYIPETRGLEISSETQIPIEPFTAPNGVRYLGFRLLEVPIPAETAIRFTLSEGGTLAEVVEEPSFIERNMVPLLGLLILFSILSVSAYIFRQTDNEAENRIPEDRDALIAAIAELDARYESGDIVEADYKIEREVLKTTLRKYM